MQDGGVRGNMVGGEVGDENKRLMRAEQVDTSVVNVMLEDGTGTAAVGGAVSDLYDMLAWARWLHRSLRVRDLGRFVDLRLRRGQSCYRNLSDFGSGLHSASLAEG